MFESLLQLYSKELAICSWVPPRSDLGMGRQTRLQTPLQPQGSPLFTNSTYSSEDYLEKIVKKQCLSEKSLCRGTVNVFIDSLPCKRWNRFLLGFLPLVSLHSRVCKEQQASSLLIASVFLLLFKYLKSCFPVLPNNQLPACLPQAPPFFFPLVLICLMWELREGGAFYVVCLPSSCPTVLPPRFFYLLTFFSALYL